MMHYFISSQVAVILMFLLVVPIHEHVGIVGKCIVVAVPTSIIEHNFLLLL